MRPLVYCWKEYQIIVVLVMLIPRRNFRNYKSSTRRLPAARQLCHERLAIGGVAAGSDESFGVQSFVGPAT